MAIRRSFMLIAGEASGDTLGAELVKSLRARFPEAVFFGAGGPRMQEAGVESALNLAEHAVVGIWEVVLNYAKFKGFFDQLLTLAKTRKPDVVILIDYPGFNLRFAAALKKRARTIQGWSPKIVFYVSPQIWAWHESRIHQIARDIDLMLTIFPFERNWYHERKPDFKVEFVGHPLIDRYAAAGARPLDEPTGPDPMIALLPGSRVRELKKHLPVVVGVAREILRRRTTRFRMVVPSESLAVLARSYLSENDRIEIVVGGLSATLEKANLAIASSGTVTMECAFFGVPTIVLYRTSWSTYLLGRRFIKVKFLAMPNLLAGELIYPEFIQTAARPEPIAGKANELLNNTEGRRVIKAKLAKVIGSLGGGGASVRAADAILRLFERN